MYIVGVVLIEKVLGKRTEKESGSEAGTGLVRKGSDRKGTPEEDKRSEDGHSGTEGVRGNRE